MTIAFTGPRPNKLGGYIVPNSTFDWVARELDKALQVFKPSEVISGMALGVDLWACSLAQERNIPVCAAVPFKGQESQWPRETKEAYYRLLSKCVRQEIICSGGYAPLKMQLRNQWMVDNCDLLVAVWNGTPGGTANCVNYARKVNKESSTKLPKKVKRTLAVSCC